MEEHQKLFATILLQCLHSLTVPKQDFQNADVMHSHLFLPEEH